ncbi:MAG: hypothetical protein AB7I27_12065 [Bacteriovoracaceae bacterium]
MKNFSLILTTLLLLTACSKEVKEIVKDSSMPAPSMDTLRADSSEEDMAALKMLLESESPNLALAELLAKSLASKHASAVKEVTESLTEDEVKLIIQDVLEKNNKIRSNYLFHGQRYRDNNALITSSLISSEQLKGRPFSLEDQLKIKSYGYLKSKHLDEVIKNFDHRASELASELSYELAYQIAINDSKTANQINELIGSADKDKIIDIIRKSKPFVEELDKRFKSSELNEKEQYIVVMSGILAGAVYTRIKDDSGFKKIILEAKRIENFVVKAKEFSVLINTLSQHFEKSEESFRDFTTGVIQVREDLISLYKTASNAQTIDEKVEAKRILNFLYETSFAKNQDALKNESILSKNININVNLEKSLNAAKDLSQNLSTILQTANSMMSILHIQPSKSLLKVMDKAQKVSAALTVAQTAITGFSSGGVIGALGALSSSPMMSLMGGAHSKDSVMIAQINRKLDFIIENQRQILKMQFETMNMIKELALMIDIYHQQQMSAIAELRDYALVGLEIQKSSLNKEIRSCERLINYQLSSVWKNFDFGKDSFNSINNLELIRTRFFKNINSLSDVKRLINSTEGSGFEACQVGIAEAFGGNNTSENPIRAIFSTSENEDLYKFQNEIYLPLLSYLKFYTKNGNINTLPLHIPVDNFYGLQFKDSYFKYMPNEVSDEEVYDLDNLVSTKNLERYLSHLLILYPIIELDKQVWSQSHTNIVEEYLNNANIGHNQNTRSNFFLVNALELTQSAIAQEALLSGEPILSSLLQEFGQKIFENTPCTEVTSSKMPDTNFPFFCSVRNNKLLMKNLVQYNFLQNALSTDDFFQQYELAYKFTDKKGLSKLMNLNVSEDRFIVKKNDDEGYDLFVNVAGKDKETISIKLADPASLKEAKILYSENMSRLIKMQELIIQALEKITPVSRSQQGADLSKILLVGAKDDFKK